MYFTKQSENKHILQVIGSEWYSMIVSPFVHVAHKHNFVPSVFLFLQLEEHNMEYACEVIWVRN